MGSPARLLAVARQPPEHPSRHPLLFDSYFVPNNRDALSAGFIDKVLSARHCDASRFEMWMVCAAQHTPSTHAGTAGAEERARAYLSG